MSQAYLDISAVDMQFTRDGQSNPVLQGIDLQVQRGEFIALIGHSGCGKSTVLNIVAGLLQPTRGGVILEGREVNAPGPDRAVVFQNHSLLPWLTVYQNVEIAVDKIFARTRSKAERRDWILHNLEMVNMTHALQRLPSEISGGMKQRVGIARALAMEPKVLLLDEPFGALDARVRKELRTGLRDIHDQTGLTTVFVTHDQDEAMELSDLVVVMSMGRIEQIGTPQDIRARPATKFVREFIAA